MARGAAVSVRVSGTGDAAHEGITLVGDSDEFDSTTDLDSISRSLDVGKDARTAIEVDPRKDPWWAAILKGHVEHGRRPHRSAGPERLWDELGVALGTPRARDLKWMGAASARETGDDMEPVDVDNAGPGIWQ